jgi:hypothetical protein
MVKREAEHCSSSSTEITNAWDFVSMCVHCVIPLGSQENIALPYQKAATQSGKVYVETEQL